VNHWLSGNDQQNAGPSPLIKYVILPATTLVLQQCERCEVQTTVILS